MNIGSLLRRRAHLTGVLMMTFALVACTSTPEAKSAKFMAEGKRLLEQKDANRAILQFRNAAQLTPKNAEVYYQLGLASLDAGDIRGGLISLQKALDLDPKHKEAQLRLSQLMASTVEPSILKEAQKRLRGLLQDDPENAGALHALALTELKLGNSDDSMRHFERAAERAPQDLFVAASLANAKLLQRDPKGAEEVLKRASQNAPNSADAVAILGRFYSSQNRLADAERQYARALEMDPKHPVALVDLAMLQDQKGRLQEAEKNFKTLSDLSDKTNQHSYANFLFQHGRKDEALTEFERLAKRDPNDRLFRTRLIAAFQAADRLPDAQKVLNDALKRNPKDLDALLQRGEISLAARNYDSAEGDFNQVLRLQPDAPEVHFALGRLYLARGATSRYKEELYNALKLNPFLMPIRLELAQFLSSEGGKGATTALDLLDSAPISQRESVPLIVKRNWALWSLKNFAEMRRGIDRGLAREKSTDLLLQDGIWKLQAGNYSGAQAVLEQALNIDSTNLDALAVLNQAYVGQNQRGMAVQKVKEYVAQQPKSAMAQQLLGVVLMANGDRTQARAAFMAAKSIDPHYVTASITLTQLDVLEGKWEDARGELTSVLANDPENARALLWLGQVEAVKGNKAAALEHFRKAVANGPENALALNNLAYLLAEQAKQPDEALKYAERAVELAPDNGDFVDTLGWILYQKGLYRPAIKNLENAASKNSNVVPKYHLAMAYAKAGEMASARNTLNAALKLNPNVPEAQPARELLK